MDIVSKSLISNEGYFAIIIENKSKTQKLEATYTFKEDRVQNGALLTPTQNPMVFSLVVNPGEIKTIVGRQIDLFKASSFPYSYS